jgi:hypothetical protein
MKKSCATEIIVDAGYERKGKERRPTQIEEGTLLHPGQVIERKRSGSFTQKLKSAIGPRNAVLDARSDEEISLPLTRKRSKSGSSKSVIVKSQTLETMDTTQQFSPKMLFQPSKIVSPLSRSITSPKVEIVSPKSSLCSPPMFKCHTFNEYDCLGGKESGKQEGNRLFDKSKEGGRSDTENLDRKEGRCVVSRVYDQEKIAERSSLIHEEIKSSGHSIEKKKSSLHHNDDLPVSPYRKWRDFEVTYIPASSPVTPYFISSSIPLTVPLVESSGPNMEHGSSLSPVSQAFSPTSLPFSSSQLSSTIGHPNVMEDLSS